MSESCKDRYKCIREIGGGSTGTVWEGFDTKTKRPVALKFLNVKSSSLDYLKRLFDREVRIHARLTHESILALHDYCKDDEEHPFYAMELVTGGSPNGPSLLARLEAGQEFSFPQIVEIARQLISALDYLCSKDVVHLDLKPANLLLEDRLDGGVRVRIADFSCASSPLEETLTTPGVLRGTPDYWSPEQERGEKPDSRADVWGFGAVMHKLLTGRAPRGNPVLYGAAVRADAGPWFVDLVRECLAREPGNRPPAGELRQRLATNAGQSNHSVALDKSHATGRERELNELGRLLEESLKQSRLALIGGPEGIGKSRLVDALERRAQAAGTFVLRAVVRGDGVAPYAALCQIIEAHHYRSAQPGDFDEIADKLARHFPPLQHLRPGTRADRRRRTRAPDKQTLLALLADAFRRIASQQHTLVILENIHLGSVTIEAVKKIAAQAGLAKLLLVATYDSEVTNEYLRDLREAVHSSPTVYKDIELRPLTRDGEQKVIAELLASDDIDHETVARIHELSGGLPLLTTLLVNEWLDGEAFQRDTAGRWRLRTDAEIAAHALPSIRSLIGRQVSRLPKGLRSLLQRGSAAVGTFSIADLATLAGRKEGRVALDVARLVNAQFLRQEHRDQFAFERKSVQQWVHESVPKNDREQWHLTLAQRLQQEPSRFDREIHGLLQIHYREAGFPEKSCEHGLFHAQVCLDGFDPRAAIAVARAVLSLSRSDRTSGKAHLLIAHALKMLEEIDDALHEVSSAFMAFSHGGDAAQMCETATLAVQTSWQYHRMGDLRRWLRDGLRLARTRMDKAALTELLEYQAMSEALLGKDSSAAEVVSELSSLSPAPPPGERSQAMLHIPFGSKTDSIDPTTSNLRWTADVAALVFDTLTRIDDFGRVIPWLAEEVRASDDYRHYRVRMRAGVRFHDDRECTARDVKWSLERLFRLARQYHMLPDDIVGGEAVAAGRARELTGVIVADGGETLEINLNRPIPALDRMLSDPAFSVLPYGTETMPRDRRTGLVGTGPYYLERLVPGREIAFRAHPRYWQSGIPRTEEIVLSLGVEPDEIAHGFRAGQYSLAFDLTPKEHDRLRVDLEHGWHYERKPTLSTCFAAFNIHRGGPLSSKSAREAVINAIDVDAIARSVRGMAIPAHGLFPPALLEPERRRRPYDSPTQSNEELKIVCSMTFAAMFPGLAKQFELRLSNKGFQVKLQSEPARQLDTAPEADIYLGYFACDYPDLDGFALPLLHSQVGVIGRFCGSDRIDHLLMSSRAEGQPGAFQALYRELQQHLVEEALICPLLHPTAYCFVSPSVKNFHLRNFFPSIRYEELVMN